MSEKTNDEILREVFELGQERQSSEPCEDCYGSGSAGGVIEHKGRLCFASWKCAACDGTGDVSKRSEGKAR